MEEQSKAVPPAGRGRRAKAVLFVTLVAVSAGIVGSVATRAFGHGPGHWRAGIFTPAQIEQRVDRAIKHLAIEADATAEQQAKLAAIALLTAPTIDRAAIEQFRSEQLQLADAASKRVAQARADAGEVLTADQRQKLADRVTGGPWGHWR